MACFVSCVVIRVCVVPHLHCLIGNNKGLICQGKCVVFFGNIYPALCVMCYMLWICWGMGYFSCIFAEKKFPRHFYLSPATQQFLDVSGMSVSQCLYLWLAWHCGRERRGMVPSASADWLSALVTSLKWGPSGREGSAAPPHVKGYLKWPRQRDKDTHTQTNRYQTWPDYILGCQIWFGFPESGRWQKHPPLVH